MLSSINLIISLFYRSFNGCYLQMITLKKIVWLGLFIYNHHQNSWDILHVDVYREDMVAFPQCIASNGIFGTGGYVGHY